MFSRSRSSLLGNVYVVIGLIVAISHHYFAHIHNIKEVAELVLAILLWPLVLLGVSMRF
jgi:hypothetical protein